MGRDTMSCFVNMANPTNKAEKIPQFPFSLFNHWTKKVKESKKNTFFNASGRIAQVCDWEDKRNSETVNDEIIQ